MRGSQPASAVVQLPAGLSEQAGSVLVANITLNFQHESHQDYMVVLNGPDDASQVEAGSPFYLGTILMFGHHAHGGAMSYAIPLGDKLSQARAAADGSIQLRVVPLNVMEHHHDSADASAVELLAVNVESY
jgi:tyrosinase